MDQRYCMPISVTPKIYFNVKGRGGGVIRGRGSVRLGIPLLQECQWRLSGTLFNPVISVAIISFT